MKFFKFQSPLNQSLKKKIKKMEWLEFSKKSTEHLRIFNFLTKDQSF